MILLAATSPSKGNELRQHLITKTTFANELRFIRELIREPASVGAIAATGKYAARAMAARIPLGSSLPVLELGPGTGSITRAILQRGVPPEKLVSVEHSSEFCDHLRERFPGVNIVNGDALDLKSALAGTPFRRFSAVVSGVPLLNLPKPARAKMITDALSLCEPGAPLVQFTYGPRPPMQAAEGAFSVSFEELIVRNVPPAWIYVYRSVQGN